MEKLEQLKQGSVKFNCERHDGRVHPRGRAEVMWLHFEWTIRRKQSKGGWVSEHVLPVRQSPLSETDCSRLPPVTVKTKSTAGRPAALRYELLSVSSWAQVVKLQGCANKRRHTAHEPKAKLSCWLKWKCTPCRAHPIMHRREGPGLRGIELSQSYLQVLAPSPWLRATDQRSSVWLQSAGDQEGERGPRSWRSQSGQEYGCCAFNLQNKKPTRFKWWVVFLYFLFCLWYF